MTLNLAALLRQSAHLHPEKAALVVGDMSLPYRVVHDYAQRFAGGLAELGLSRGEHVALFLPNVPHFTIAYFGAHYAGLPVVPLNVLLTADEIAYHLDDSQAAAIVVWEGFLEQALAGAAQAKHCKHVIV